MCLYNDQASRLRQNTHEAGNAILIILVAVVMFGALSFAVSDMIRGANPEALSTEKAKIEANAILGFGRIIRLAIQDMKINGCADADISFETTILDEDMKKKGLGTYAHTPPTRDTCKVFGPAGGGVNYAAPSVEWLDPRFETEQLYGHWYFPSAVCIPGVGTAPEDGCDSDGEINEAIIAVLPYVNKAVCKGLLERLERVSDDTLEEDGTFPKEDGNAWNSSLPFFRGQQLEGEVLNQDYLKHGCFEGESENSSPPAGSYHFFQVLVAR